MNQLAQIDAADGSIMFLNAYWSLEIETRDTLNPHRLFDLANGLPLADSDYCYDLVLDPAGDAGYQGQTVTAQCVRFVSWTSADLPEGITELRLRGRFDFGLLGPTDIDIEHIFRLPADAPWFEEQICLVHRFGRDDHALREVRFGFRKTIYDRDAQQWRDNLDRRVLVPVPHRRRWGQNLDYLATSYSMPDIIPANWSGHQLPARAAEAWLWTDGNHGYLIAKYDRAQIEFALVDGEFVVAQSKRANNFYRTFHPTKVGGADVCLRFGGAGRYHGAPDGIRDLSGETSYTFGTTRILPVAGDWRAGYRAYKQFLLEKGHGCPPDFDPPVHWNELYNLNWRGGENAPLQELPQLYHEAELAQDIGAEAFYFDPVWDIWEGSSLWDEARLGSLTDFVATMRTRYGLKTSLHLMSHTKSKCEDPRIYRRDESGAIATWGGLYSGGYICAASSAWQAQKIERLLRLAEAGVTFFMFDFQFYTPPDAHLEEARLRGGACWAGDHGHTVPLTMQEHSEGILKVIQAVKEEHPNVLIEAHDRITSGMQDFHPLYFQHGLPHSFDENWGFEYMWDSLIDLLSGKALSLYEYNLAYDIPLYLHFHCGLDNEQMLGFWWYASTVRHIGIGGVKDPAAPLYRALKYAMQIYLRLKPFFTRGRFVGIDTLIHAHVLSERDACVFVLFNLGSQPLIQHVSISLQELGISALKQCHGAHAEVIDGELVFTVEVLPLSPYIVEINTDLPSAVSVEAQTLP